MTNKVHEYLSRISRLYYEGSPEISDEQFDQLAESSGYHEVGAKQHDNTAKHFRHMYSLQKHYEEEKIKSPLEGYRNLSMTAKLDGAALSLLYVQGKLVQALTRGDGVEGRIVTDKFLATKLVPHTIEEMGIVQVTGEIVAPSHVENSRNYAAGALNLGSTDEFRTRSVEFFAYGVYPYLSETFDKDMQTLESFGFHTVLDPELPNEYPTDGLVLRINDNSVFESLGYTAKFPKGSYARKIRAEAVETTLLAVEWNTGKSGKVTPVAILEPVMIGDKNVSRATLNNGEYIRALGLYIGCRVAVIMGGEVIPRVLHLVE